MRWYRPREFYGLNLGVSGARQTSDELGESFSDLCVGDTEIIVHEFDGFPRSHQVIVELLLRAVGEFARGFGLFGEVRHAVKEERDLNLKRLTDFEQIVGVDPIGAILVFLNLLEGTPIALPSFVWLMCNSTRRARTREPTYLSIGSSPSNFAAHRLMDYANCLVLNGFFEEMDSDRNVRRHVPETNRAYKLFDRIRHEGHKI